MNSIGWPLNPGSPGSCFNFGLCWGSIINLHRVLLPDEWDKQPFPLPLNSQVSWHIQPLLCFGIDRPRAQTTLPMTKYCTTLYQTVYSVLCTTVHILHCVLYYSVHTALCTVLQCTNFTLYCTTVHTLHCVLYYRVHTLHCVLYYSAHTTLCTVLQCTHCIVYNLVVYWVPNQECLIIKPTIRAITEITQILLTAWLHCEVSH